MRSLCEEPLSLRCHAYLKGNLYYAECIDLGLVVARATMAEAQAALDDAIELTLESAAAHGFLDEVLKRKSPLRSRLLYHWLGMLLRLERFIRWFEFVGSPAPVRFRHQCGSHA